MNGSKPKFELIDLFAGAGGLSNGFEQTGRFQVVGAVEINKAAVATYIQNHNKDENIIIRVKNEKGKKNKFESDITKISFKQVLAERNLDKARLIVIGGPPCQGFSNANRQKNYIISGNNQLVKEYVRAIKEIEPIAFLMENVKAMDSKKHKFFVTEHAEGGKFAFSSEQHLRDVKSYSEYGKSLSRETLWQDDFIDIIESEHTQLRVIIQSLIEQGDFQPIVTKSSLISRLRSIEKTFLDKKGTSIKLEKENEIREVFQLVNDYLQRDRIDERLIRLLEETEAVNILDDALDVLNTIQREEVLKNTAREKLGPLIDLNRFLLHYKELQDEKILLRRSLEVSDEEGLLKVTAFVKSYNVVEYLRCVFEYMGYEIDLGVLTASNFGVPQKRERFMILGILKENLKTQNLKADRLRVELPKKGLCIEREFNTKDAIYDLKDVAPYTDRGENAIISYPEQYIRTGLSEYYRKGNDANLIFNHINTKSEKLSLERFKAIREGGGKNFHDLSEELKDTYADATRTQNTIYLRLNYDEPSRTVVNVRKSMWNHPEKTRAISIREAARLQSFRDNFKFEGTKDQQYQQVGNAVPPLLARGVAEKMLDLLGDRPVTYLEEELGIKYVECPDK